MAVSGSNSEGLSKHQHVIESLAQENSTSVERVRALFEEEHARLHADARVKTFVSVIATRLVRNALHAERNSGN